MGNASVAATASFAAIVASLGFENKNLIKQINKRKKNLGLLQKQADLANNRGVVRLGLGDCSLQFTLVSSKPVLDLKKKKKTVRERLLIFFFFFLLVTLRFHLFLHQKVQHSVSFL